MWTKKNFFFLFNEEGNLIGSNTGERPNHQSFIPNPLRKSKEHFKRTNETMSFQPESFTVPNQVVHYLITTRTHTHTHIRSSTIRNLPRCDRTEQCPNKTIDTVHTKLFSSFWPSNQGRSVTSGKIEWANLPVSAGTHFAWKKHFLFT
jgi:hypothetical protein